MVSRNSASANPSPHKMTPGQPALNRDCGYAICTSATLHSTKGSCTMTRLLVVFALLVAWQLTPAGAQAPDPVKIGVQSLFDEVSADKIPSLLKSFEDLVKEMTGL